MSTYVRPSSCATTTIPTVNGNVMVNGAPLNPSVMFPVSVQGYVDQFCDSDEAKQKNYPGGCSNFLRNNNMVDFVTNLQNSFGPQNTDMLIQQIGLCQSLNLKDYLEWRVTQPTADNSQVSNINTICGVNANIIIPSLPPSNK